MCLSHQYINQENDIRKHKLHASIVQEADTVRAAGVGNNWSIPGLFLRALGKA